MNVLTSPLFLIRQRLGRVNRYSFQDLVLRRYESGSLIASNPVQEVGQLQFLTNLVSTMWEDIHQESGETDPPDFEDIPESAIDAWISKWAPSFEVFADQGPRFMQHVFQEGEGVSRDDVYPFLAVDMPGSTTASNFDRKPALRTSAYCPECAALDLYTFHMMTPGAGKGSSGPHLSGVNTLIPKDDALDMVLANTILRPSVGGAKGFAGCMVTMDKQSCPDSFPWRDAQYCDLLTKGTKLQTGDALINTRYFRFWMPRQVWLTRTRLPSPRPCLCCGNLTEWDVSSIQEGEAKPQKPPPPEGEAKTKGALCLPAGDYLSPFKPFALKKQTEGARKGEMAERPYTLTSMQRLLSVASEFLIAEGDHKPAPVIGRISEGRRPKSIRIFVADLGGKAAFSSSLQADIPLTSNMIETAERLKKMADAAQNQHDALFGALTHFFQPKDWKKCSEIVQATGTFDIFTGNFASYMNDPDPVPEKDAEGNNVIPRSRWETDLYRKARELYEAAVGNDLIGTRKKVKKGKKESEEVFKTQLFAEGLRFVNPKQD